MEHEIKIKVDTCGLIEITAAIAEAISLMESARDLSNDTCTYYNTQSCLRTLLTDIHAQMRAPSESHYDRETYGKGRQHFF